jgi:alkaline phosphatase
MHSRSKTSALGLTAALVALSGGADAAPQNQRAKNVIFFVGDGMGVSTTTAARVYSVGVDGQLVLDQFPYTALSKTYSADTLTPDSAPTMSAMVSGVNTNNGVIGFDAKTENKDFHGNGDGAKTLNFFEQAKQAGKSVGVVSTARVTHATPAACYAHINDRDNENAIALQSLPTDATYNAQLAGGVDLIAGGGRRV